MPFQHVYGPGNSPCFGGSFWWHLLSMGKWWYWRVAPFCARRSRIKKPLSAMTSSPHCSLSKHPVSCTILLSLAQPDHSSDTKVKLPFGSTEARALNVFRCLYWLQVILCDDGIVGFCDANSVQSIIDRTFLKILEASWQFMAYLFLCGPSNEKTQFLMHQIDPSGKDFADMACCNTRVGGIGRSETTRLAVTWVLAWLISNSDTSVGTDKGQQVWPMRASRQVWNKSLQLHYNYKHL